jgi:heme exporter protein B
MWILFQHELKYYIKNLREAIYLYSYYISIIFLVPFAFSAEAIGAASLAIPSLWVALASGVAIGAQQLFRRDEEAGLLAYYQLLPIQLEWVVAGKWLAFFVFLLVPVLACLPIAGLMMDLSPPELWRCAIGLTAGALGLTVLATLSAALLVGLEKAGALLSLILLPLCIPILIFGSEYCRSDASGDALSHLVMLFGFACFMLPVMCLAGAASIRASH